MSSAKPLHQKRLQQENKHTEKKSKRMPFLKKSKNLEKVPKMSKTGGKKKKKGKNGKKKKNPKIFFSQVFLRPAHYTLGTLLGPKSQKKQELGCFEHLEFIPQPFSVPPVHFVRASALSKNRKISKKKKSQKFSTSVFEACSLHPMYPSGTKKSKKARIELF